MLERNSVKHEFKKNFEDKFKYIKIFCLRNDHPPPPPPIALFPSMSSYLSEIVSNCQTCQNEIDTSSFERSADLFDLNLKFSPFSYLYLEFLIVSFP